MLNCVATEHRQCEDRAAPALQGKHGHLGGQPPDCLPLGWASSPEFEAVFRPRMIRCWRSVPKSAHPASVTRARAAREGLPATPKRAAVCPQHRRVESKANSHQRPLRSWANSSRAGLRITLIGHSSSRPPQGTHLGLGSISSTSLLCSRDMFFSLSLCLDSPQPWSPHCPAS